MTVGWDDRLALLEDAAFKPHENPDCFGVGFDGWLVGQKHVGIGQVIDGVAKLFNGLRLFDVSAPADGRGVDGGEMLGGHVAVCWVMCAWKGCSGHTLKPPTYSLSAVWFGV